MVLSLQLEGVDPLFKVDKALSFTDLFKELEGIGLVKPSPTPKKGRASESVGKLAQSHKEKVYFVSEKK